MVAAGIAPNLERSFGFEKLHGYDAGLHAEEKRALRERVREPEGIELLGLEIDAPTRRTALRIVGRHFPDAPIRVEWADFRKFEPEEDLAFVVCNPPYGVRIGEEEDMRAAVSGFGGVSGAAFAGACGDLHRES